MARIELFARTEVGCARERNEDAFLVVDLGAPESGLRPEQRVVELAPPGTVIAVCDGMGGAAAGDIASEMAVEGLERAARAGAPFTSVEQAETTLVRAVRQVNETIMDYAGERPERRGMGTTITAALVVENQLVVVHVGDSRAYLRRGRALKQLTFDQSVVGQLIASGELTPEQARTYEQRNVLLQALGVQPVVRPELLNVEVMAGDVFMLCSDGLTGPLTDPEILDIMLRYEDPVRCCRALTEAACVGGGPDNVTVALARFIGEPLVVPTGPTPIRFTRRETTT